MATFSFFGHSHGSSTTPMAMAMTIASHSHPYMPHQHIHSCNKKFILISAPGGWEGIIPRASLIPRPVFDPAWTTQGQVCSLQAYLLHCEIEASHRRLRIAYLPCRLWLQLHTLNLQFHRKVWGSIGVWNALIRVHCLSVIEYMITVLCGTDNIPHNGCGGYSVEYCQFHITLLWIWIMLGNLGGILWVLWGHMYL